MKKISETEQYEEHLNKYNVIHLDVQWFYMDCGCAENVVSHITRSVLNELKEEFPDVDFSESASLGGMLARITLATGSKFIIIIDEWDVLIRDEAANAAVQKEYINFLRGLFKGTEPTRFLHLAYLTGILPIKKVKTQSALNNFEEYTMLTPANFAPLYWHMTRSIERPLFQMRKSGRNLSLQRKAKSGMNCLIFRENQKNYWKQP